MSTFAVTAMGRSGTMFLAHALNQAPDWHVEHEPVGGLHPTREVQKRFSTARNGSPPTNYGEVNSWLRYCFPGLRVDRKAVILRDPHQIFQSMFNRGRPDLKELVHSLYVLDGLVQSGVRVIAFSRMTTDAGYLQRVALDLGVRLPLGCPHSSKNESSFLPMPADLRTKADKYLAWYIKQYERRW